MKTNESMIEVEKDYYNDLIAKANTLNAYCDLKFICPKCKKYYIINGLVCLGCRYEGTGRN